MDGLALVFLLAVVIEKLIEIFKNIVYSIPFLPDEFRPLTLELISLALGLVLAFEVNMNAMDLLNVKLKDPSIGIAITGLAVGKGANFAHDFFHVIGDNHKNGKSVGV